MNYHLTAILLCTAPLAAQQYVHLDAQVNSPSSPVTITLPAGCWRITPVGPAAGGLYTAWHPWNGTNASCNTTGLGCSQGWATLYWMGSSVGGSQYGGTGFTATQALALANSTPSTYYLPQAAAVNFGVADNSLNDNLGGVSLRIDAIVGCNNPATVTTYGVGSNGSNGVPNMASSGLPTLGDESFELQLDHGAGNSVLAWLIGSTQANVPLPGFGATGLVQPLLLSLSGTTDSAGDSALPIPLPCDPVLLCGVRLTCQAVVLDTAATGDLAFSNGIDFTVGS